MKIIKYIFILILLPNLDSNCFGAKELCFEEIGCKVFVQNSGIVSFVDCNKEHVTIVDIAGTNDGNVFKEIFICSLRLPEEGPICFIIWPLGIYGICNSSCRLIEKFSSNQFIKVDKYFLFLRKGKVYLGKENKELIYLAPIPKFDFVIESLQLNFGNFDKNLNKFMNSSIIVCGENKKVSLPVEDFVKFCDNSLTLE